MRRQKREMKPASETSWGDHQYSELVNNKETHCQPNPLEGRQTSPNVVLINARLGVSGAARHLAKLYLINLGLVVLQDGGWLKISLALSIPFCIFIGYYSA